MVRPERNGAFDGNEWLLPGVTVTIEEASISPMSQSLRFEAASLNRTAITAADGSYFFGELTPGAYRVTAMVTLKGFDFTSDTDGLADWVVAVDVVAQMISQANFAGIGHGEITGQVFDVTSLQGVAAAVIRCRWSGYDDILGTTTTSCSPPSLTTPVRRHGRRPYGYFTCEGLDRSPTAHRYR